MRLIIGGANQGKTDFVMKKYHISSDKIIGGENFRVTDVSGFGCIDNFHLFVKRLLEIGENPIEAAEKIMHENPDIMIIMNEIGNGIIPLEKSERIWREQVGKTGCFLAEKAESVERIVCGIAVKIKG